MTSGRALARVLLGLLLGTTLGTLMSSYRPTDALVVGGTGRTLSVVVLAQHVVIIGGGSIPDEIVEQADRATVPWQRPYELAIVPGWDTEHLPGTLSLLERRAVRSLVILGQPGNDAGWTILERQAERYGVEARIAEEPSAIQVGATTRLELYPTTDGSAVCVTHAELRIAIVDATSSSDRWSVCQPVALTIALRQPPPVEAPLVIRPRPRNPQAVTPRARYEVQLDRGERLTLRLGTREIRVPGDRVVSAPTPSPSR